LLKGEQDDPVLQIDCSGEVLKMIQKFLKLLQEKQDRTQESIFKIDQAYFKFKKDQERELIEKG
jgi:vacuolar-type H+-ATPase subunit D/Vma8